MRTNEARTAGAGGGAPRGPAAVLLAGFLLAAAGCGRMGGSEGQIRVVTDPPGASIVCDGIPQEQSPCTMARLPAGVHIVAATKAGYREARRSVPLFEGQRVAIEMKLEQLNGLVLVESSPAGAQVTVDGAFRGATPFFLADLPLGEHRFAFVAPGHLQKEVDIQLDDRIPLRVAAELVPDAGVLQVRSEPPGATVRLNGVERGTTPCTVSGAPSGENVVEVVLPGYVPYTERLLIRAQEERSIMASLVPVPTKLTVVSIPPGARVYVDNQYRGDSPVELTDLQPGLHRLRAEMKGFDTAARDVSLVEESAVVEEFRLVKNSGKIVVVSEPSGATVFLNGEEVGTTATAGSDVVSDPLELDLLSPGTYRVQLYRKGYSHTPRTVRLGPNQVVDMHEKMVRRYIPDTRVRLKWQTGEIVRDGMVLREFPGGDIELQLETGTIMKIRAEDILSREPIRGGA